MNLNASWLLSPLWIAALVQGMSILTMAASGEQAEISMKYIEQDGLVFVSALELEANAGIAVKSLPGRSELAACKAEQCILVDRLDKAGDTMWIPLKQIADGFGATWSTSEDREVVRLYFTESDAVDANSSRNGGVGSLVPAMRFPLLGGGSMSLDELRGKRVLMNSWASW